MISRSGHQLLSRSSHPQMSYPPYNPGQAYVPPAASEDQDALPPSAESAHYPPSEGYSRRPPSPSRAPRGRSRSPGYRYGGRGSPPPAGSNGSAYDGGRGPGGGGYDRYYRDGYGGPPPSRGNGYEREGGGRGMGGPGGYDRYEGRAYDRYDRFDRYERGPLPGAFGGRRRSPPRRKREVVRGTDADRKQTACLYVGNLPYGFREDDVQSIFERYGVIRHVTVPLDRSTGKNKGFAFVTFEDRRDAEEAKDKLDDYMVEHRRLKLDWDPGMERKDELKGGRGPHSVRGAPYDEPRRDAWGPGGPPPMSSAPYRGGYGGPPPEDYGRGGAPPYDGYDSRGPAPPMQDYRSGGYEERRR
ncbi:hypothetical protein BJ742DRAFT_852896 [Cladochytrium replicatum]|nr:hypothetical protein BJ742DRAFT_852896 [Cladochytrium replicatum]